MNGKVVGSRMREKRREKNMTQQEFSKACKISMNYYSSIENGRNSPSLETLNVIGSPPVYMRLLVSWPMGVLQYIRPCPGIGELGIAAVEVMIDIYLLKSVRTL